MFEPQFATRIYHNGTHFVGEILEGREQISQAYAKLSRNGKVADGSMLEIVLPSLEESRYFQCHNRQDIQQVLNDEIRSLNFPKLHPKKDYYRIPAEE